MSQLQIHKFTSLYHDKAMFTEESDEGEVVEYDELLLGSLPAVH